jgi:uncharacterized membrane protein
MTLKELIEQVGELGDMLGVAIIALGMLWGGVRFLWAVARGAAVDGYSAYRLQLIRTLLLGLEVLVAADIIRTVAVSPSLGSVGVLAAIVGIRTFLSWSLILGFAVEHRIFKNVQSHHAEFLWVTQTGRMGN